MVLGLPSGMVSGFVDRWHEIDEERASASAAQAKALNAKIAAWQKLNPIKSVIEDKLKLKDIDFPVWLPESYKASYMRAAGQATERGIDAAVGKYYKGWHDGKLPEPDFTDLAIRYRGIGRPLTPTMKRVYENFLSLQTKPDDPDVIKRFAPYGGAESFFKVGRQNREKNRRKARLDSYKPTDSVDLFTLPGWGNENGNIGEAVVVNKDVYKHSSLINGRGISSPTIVMAPSEGNRGAVVMGENALTTQQANIDLMRAIDNAVSNDPEFAKRLSLTGSRAHKDVKNWMDTLAKTPLATGSGAAPAGGGDWVNAAFPNITRVLNQKPPSKEAAETSFIASASGAKNTSEFKVPKHLHSSSNGDFFNNLRILEKKAPSDRLHLAYATDFKGDKQSLAKTNSLGKIDPLSQLTYEQSINVRDAFNQFRKGQISTEVYYKTVANNMPDLLNSDTNIINYGDIYEMTMIALEAHELQGRHAHLKMERRHITGDVYRNFTPATSQYVENALKNKGADIKIRDAHRDKTRALGEMSRELRVILSYLGENAGRDGVQLDDAILNSGGADLTVTGMYSDLIKRAQSGLINIGNFVKGIKQFTTIGRGRAEDLELQKALSNSALDPVNKTMLERISDKVTKSRQLAEGDQTNRAYLQRSVIEFKKLALTYKLSGMVQGESTGGRTISNQDFEVMLKALWGTQEASQVRLQSLVQRIETLRTINEIDLRLKETGTHAKVAEHSLSRKMREEMAMNFHRNLQNKIKKEKLAENEPREVIDSQGNLARPRSPKVYTEALSNLSRQLNDPQKYPRITESELNNKKLENGDVLDDEMVNTFRHSHNILDSYFGEGDNVPFRQLQRATNKFMSSRRTIADQEAFMKVYQPNLDMLKSPAIRSNINEALELIGVSSQKQRAYIYGSYVSLFNAVAGEVAAAIQ